MNIRSTILAAGALGAALAPVSSYILNAQTLGTVQGVVADADGLFLPGVTIKVPALKRGAVSRKNGEFTILRIPAGQYDVEATSIGYQKWTGKLVVPENGGTVTLKITLQLATVLGGEVVVMGDRLKGQAKALNTQRENQNITNIIAADQIGRFPDANAGDALKRVPGITVQNDQGEARFGLIRGTAARLNSVTLNGERIPSAEAENREVQLDLIPSDMIQSMEVAKALTPDMDADAIGGSINIVTRSAPAEPRISGTLGSGLNLLSEKPLVIGSVIAGQRFLDNKLGVILSGSYFDHRLGSDNVESEWDYNDDGSAFVADLQVRKYVVQRIRRSASLGLDYQIDPNNTLFLSTIYNWRDDWENRYRRNYRDMSQLGTNDEGEVRIETKGGINSSRVDNARLEDQRAANLSLSGEHLLAGLLKINWSGTYAKASEERPNERYISFRGRNLPITVNAADPSKPNASLGTSFTTADNTDYSLFSLREITEQYSYTEDEDLNARLDFEVALSTSAEYASTLKFGGRYRGKKKKRENNFFSYEPTDANAQSFTMSELGANLVDETDPGFLAGSYAAGRFASNSFLGGLDLNNSALFERSDEIGEYAAGNFSATETISGGYAMITQNVGSQLSIIAGLRLENTATDYNGFAYIADNDSVASRTGTNSYTNVMPALHARYAFDNDLIVRAAWTNTIARPNYYDITPYRLISIEDAEITEGNPSLKPTTSMNFDLMGEYYFESVGLVSAGVFHKELKDFIYTFQQRATTSKIIVDGNEYDRYSQPRNGASATITGFEVSAQRQLDFLPDFWKGFGIYANFTYTNSSAEGVSGRTGSTKLPGTAEMLYNVSLSYETSDIVLRLSLNHASDYVDEFGSEERFDRFYDKQTFLDLNGSYAFTSRLRFFFEVNNITNQPLRYYQHVPSQLMQMEYYNTRFSAGLKFDL